MKPTPLATAILGVVGGVLCFVFVLAAHRIGLQLSELVSDGLILGGAASMGVGVWGAKRMPTEEPKP